MNQNFSSEMKAKSSRITDPVDVDSQFHKTCPMRANMSVFILSMRIFSKRSGRRFGRFLLRMSLAYENTLSLGAVDAGQAKNFLANLAMLG